MSKDKTIAIDFDGVVADYSQGFQGHGVFGEPIPEARMVLKLLKEEGYTIIINTTRGELDAIDRYLRDHDLPFDYLNFNPVNDELGLSNSKVAAAIYIDDRNICFNGDWKSTLQSIREFVPWHKRSTHDVEFINCASEMVQVKLDGSKRYGTSGWNGLGPKGIFCDIHRKYVRLKHYIWDDNRDMTSENIEDTCYDLAVFALFVLMSLRKEKDCPSEE